MDQIIAEAFLFAENLFQRIIEWLRQNIRIISFG